MILLVDDEASVRDSLGGALTSAGYDVQVAEDGRAALALLRSGVQPTLMLVDLRMPVFSGWQLLDAVSRDASLAGIPRVVVTAVEDAAPAGVPVLMKPCGVDDVLGVVRRYAETLRPASASST